MSSAGKVSDNAPETRRRTEKDREMTEFASLETGGMIQCAGVARSIPARHGLYLCRMVYGIADLSNTQRHGY